MSEYGWRVRLSDHEGWIIGSTTVQVYRHTGDGRVQTMDREGVVRTIEAHEAAPSDVDWITVPTEALTSLRDAIDSQLGTRYDESLVRQLRADLEAERARIDNVLDRTLPRSDPS